jgi:uncharacterized lipoprotein
MHHVVKYVLPMSLAMTLLGCSNVFGQRGVIHDHATDYQGSVDVAPLVIPAHLSGSKMGDDYVVPKARNRGATKPPSLLPPESLPDQIARGQVHAGGASDIGVTRNRQSLLIAQDFPLAWSRFARVLRSAGYKVLVEDPKIATYFILDLPATNNTAKKDTPIYQVRLKPVAGATEVRLASQEGHPLNDIIVNRVFNDISDALAGNGKNTTTAWLHRIFKNL